MAEIQKLPDTVTLQYSELMQQCIHPAPDGANLSFKPKTISGKRYWYLFISLGARRSEHYLGLETPELLNRIEEEKALWESTEDDRKMRQRLVAMLLAGGATATPDNEGKVLSLLERSGLFLAGGIVIGTLAFRAYANMLGVLWHSELQTRDIDLASDYQYPIIMPRGKKPIDLSSVLIDSGMGFLEVPALNRKSPSTKFKIRGQELAVELLTPMRGKESAKPIEIPGLTAYAEPVRFLDYLLEDIQPAVLLYKHGVLINVPAPARFAFHKLMVSQRRRAADVEKIKRDLMQAEQLFEVLVEGRPGDLILAYEAAEKMGDKFLQQLKLGMAMIDSGVRESVEQIIGG
ncbi:MAG: GSU2403 family nucleotidyltransferase fold protein [Gammaproteobacteria bacterium]|nr:GSU2403 family nucleotidyltransferase fold protein [Gammaproteobacteria bacterium]MCW8923240.1 GSU2403 family nucleotidyltransferase fold protein [Gammaproteobacteria bacterium]